MSGNTGGKGGKKYGRNSKSCLTYFNNGTRLKNKVKKVTRHAKRFPNDDRARGWLRANA